MDWRKAWVIDQKNIKRWLELNPTLPNMSGIYILTRVEEPFKYCYIGQAKNILKRLCEHFRGYQHIDISLKKRGLYNNENTGGWKVDWVKFPLNELDKQEQEYIKKYNEMGYQLRYNKTGGGQFDKVGFEKEQTNGYYKGLKKGKEKILAEIKIYFDKYLDFTVKGKETKIKQRKLKEFEELLKGEKYE